MTQAQSACIICFAKEHGITQDVLLSEFGATRIWLDSARHEREKHASQKKEKSPP